MKVRNIIIAAILAIMPFGAFAATELPTSDAEKSEKKKKEVKYNENGEIIKHTEQLTPGASITFRLADGEADAQIREVRRNET